MKYIKTFEKATETFKPKLEIGDYVVVNTNTHDNNFNNFINTNIGQVMDINVEQYYTSVRIKYENIPSNIRYMFLAGTDELSFVIDIVKYYSKNKRDLEYLLDEEKYNL